jgi:DNA-binding MarR family transcriptional regulator
MADASNEAASAAGLEREISLLARYMLPGRRLWDRDRLERSAYALLQRLEDQGPMSIGELADAFQLDPSTVNRQTAALIRQNLADRVPDPEGGMARKLRINEEGARRLRDDREFYSAGVSAIVEGWTPAEIARFENDLRRFNQCVEELEQRPWPRPGA